MKRLALVIAVAALVCFSGILAPYLRAQKQKTPNLNGQWRDGNETLTIVQTGSTVKATYNKPHPCDPQDGSPIQYTTKYLSGTLKGNELDGELPICGYGKGNPIHGLGSSTFTLTASADGQTLSGTWHNVEANGGKGADEAWTINRICAPDSGKRCQEIGRAIGTIVAAERPAGSASLYQNLQQNLGTQLDELGNELCDDKTAQSQLDDVRKNLDSLNYVPGQSNLQNNLLIRRIEDGLRALNQRECSVAPPSGGGVCSSGEKQAEPGDEEAAKFIKDKFKEAYDKAKETAREMQEHGATVPQQVSDQIKNLKKAMDFWDQIKAGSCVPPDVMQTMQEVINDRRTEGHSENCPGMCNALKKWFEKLIGQPDSLQGKLFWEDCMARCN